MEHGKSFVALAFIGLVLSVTSCSVQLSSLSSESSSSASLSLPVSEAIASVTWMDMITGPDSINQTNLGYDVGGTDLGIPFYNATNDTMYLAFGDTFSHNDFSGNWRSNVLAKSTDYDLSDGLVIDDFITNPNGVAIPMIDGLHNFGYETTKIPTGGIELFGTLYMFYFSIKQWEPNEMNYGGVVKSNDNGETWSRVYDLSWCTQVSGGYSANIQALVNQDSNFTNGVGDVDISTHYAPSFSQIYPIDGKDGYVYILGEGNYRAEGIKMGRVLYEDFEHFEDYEYFRGFENDQAVWVKGSAGLITIEQSLGNYVIDDYCSEQSIMYNEYLGKWMVTYLRNFGEGIVYRTATNIWGPYSDAETMLPYSYPFANQGNGIYGGFVHEKYTEQNGKIIYFILSQWTPVYNSSYVKVAFE